MSLYEENAEVLRNIEANGDDLTLVRQVDFSLLFADERSARSFARGPLPPAFKAETASAPHNGEWDVTVSTTIIPSCKNITDAEEGLSALARTYGGYPDGWGFFRPN